MSIKIKHGNFTDADRRKAVNHIFSLVRKGDSITKARKFVSNGLGVSPNTLWVWQDKFGMTTPNTIKTADLVRNNGTSNLATKTSTTAIKGLESMKGQLGVVFTSLVNQDGRYSNTDATAISGVANVILGSCKQVLLERKAMNAVAKTEHLS